MAAAKKAKGAYLEEQAETVRAALGATSKADELFRLAAEAGYLTALADGAEDAAERDALIEALERLSHGIVIGWETETFLTDAWARISAEGNDARCAAVGSGLAALGQAEAGLLIGAIVAQASNGIDKSEAQALEKIGSAAGLARDKVAAIVKKARG